MHVSQIRLRDIKSFTRRGLDLDLSRSDGSVPKWIVVAGRNGAGKSTFLQAIALAIAGPSIARTVRQTYSDWVRHEATDAVVLAELSYSGSDLFSSGPLPQSSSWVGLRWRRKQEGPEPSIEREEYGGGWDPVKGPWLENPQGWFLCGYGPFRQTSNAEGHSQRIMMIPGRPSSLASLFDEGASLSEAVQWLQQLYLRRLEGNRDAAAVERTVLDVLDDGLLPEGMNVLRVTSDGLWVRTPTHVELPLKSLSDGYRTVAALVLDILKQLHQAYGHLDPIPDSPHIAFGHEGVVLIDEIDVHLHVAWQQRIGFWLKAHFPGLQFIVSTHSPFICQAADENGLIRLPAPGEEGPSRILDGEVFNRVVNGSPDDAVLTDLFGLESPYSAASEQIRSKTAELEGKAAAADISESEQAELGMLRSKLPHTPSADVADAVKQFIARFDREPEADDAED